MTQNIKQFIEEGEKELIEFISDLQKTYPLQHITPHPQYELDIRNKAKSIQISLIKMIVEEINKESEKFLGSEKYLSEIGQGVKEFKDTISSKLKEVYE